MSEDPEARPAQPAPTPSKDKPWPMSWILIAILLYALIQMTYFVFFAKG